MPKFIEDSVEQAALDWLSTVGYTHIHGGTIAPGEPAAERASYSETLLIILVETRDALLPKLISAEVRVKEMEELENT